MTTLYRPFPQGHTGGMGHPPQNPPPHRPRHRWWLWILAVVVAVIAVVGGTSLVSGRHNNTAGVVPSPAASAPVVSALRSFTGDELATLWDDRTLPCQEPLTAKGPPANTYGVVPSGVYPEADDIRARLLATTAFGAEDDVREEVQHLFVILRETQGHMVVEDRDANKAIDRANGNAAAEQHAIDHARTGLSMFLAAYNTAVGQSLARLEHGTPTTQFTDGFDVAGVCP